MNPIQPLLVLLLGIVAAIYFARLQTRLNDRVAVAVLVCVGIGMVIFPQGTVFLAHELGVGRGVDLVMYLSFVVGGFVVLMLFSRLRSLETQLTVVVRELGILRAQMERGRSSVTGQVDDRPANSQH